MNAVNLVVAREVVMDGISVKEYKPEGALSQRNSSTATNLISAEGLISRGNVDFKFIPEFHGGIGRLTRAIEAAAMHLKLCVNPSELIVDVKNDTNALPERVSLGVTKNQILMLQRWQRKNKRLPKNLTIRVYEAGTGPENGLLWMVDDYQKLMKKI